MDPDPPRAAARIVTPTFAGVFAAALSCFLAIGAVLPVLPRYVTGPVGAGDLAVGVVVGAFALSAVVGRPIGGRMADERGRRRVVLWGLGISVLAGALLFVPLGVAWLVFARLVLGLGDGWVFTAALAWALDAAPPRARGRAIALFGLAVWGGLTFGSVAGELAFRVGSFEAVWAVATLAPAVGMVVVARLREEVSASPRGTAQGEAPTGGLPGGAAAGAARPGATPTGAAHGGSVPPRPRRLPRFPPIPRPALAPGAALGLSTVGYGTMAGFVVLLLAERGVGGGATVFTVFAASVVVARLAGGGLVDRLGPVPCAAGAGLAEAGGLALLAGAGSFPVAVAGAVAMGTGFSLIFPALALIVVEAVDDRDRGVALGVFTGFFDIGVGVGAPLAGAMAALAGYEAAFWTAAALAGAATVVVLAGRRPAHTVHEEPPTTQPG